MFDEWIVSKKLLPLLKPRLSRLINAAAPHSMVSRNRLQNLHRLLRRVDKRGIEGNIVEAGVARGGSAILLASLAMQSPTRRNVWLFDAFELLDDPPALFENVRTTLFEDFGFPDDRVFLFKGLFDDVLDRYPAEPIALLHIDVSLYEPTAACMHHLLPHVASGGVIVFDNYGASEGCARAVDEKLAALESGPSLVRFGHTQAFCQMP